jgi:drug/metabolite transporter (DMT)-like permease
MLASLLWALDTLVRYPLLFGGVSASSIVLAEHLLLVAIFFPAMRSGFWQFWKLKPLHLFSFLVIGSLGSAIATIAFTRAFFVMNPSLVILLQKLQPIVAIALAKLFLKESLGPRFLLWAGVCLVGGALVSFGTSIPDFKSFDWAQWEGVPRALVAVIGRGASTVFGKILTRDGFSSKQILAGRYGIGLIAVIPYYVTGNAILLTGTENWGKMGIMVFVTGILSMFFYYRGLNRVPAKVATLAEMSYPFCAIAVNWVFLGHTLEPIQLLGGALLVAGATVVQRGRY